MSYRFKLAVAVRSDLRMGKGKIAVQVAHACITVSEDTKRQHPDWWHEWFREGQCKVVVKLGSETELSKVYEKARELGLASSIICDRGLTQLPEGTATCVGVGPGPAEIVDRVTRGYPLL